MAWILNIDDDVDDREMFCDALKEIDSSIRCIAKDSAAEAIDYLEKSNDLPNYIFVDINMPKVNGVECLKLLKRNPKLGSIPIVVLSTTNDASDIATIRKLGADFIRKEATYRGYIENLKRKILAG